jgi:hypothetical protein
MADADRGRGVLTPADRRFLGGDVALGSEQSRYDARYRIRQRTRNALLDFPILFEQLADRDREQVFDAEHDELADAVADAVACAFEMPLDERRARWAQAMTTLLHSDVHAWGKGFIDALAAADSVSRSVERERTIVPAVTAA